ncbi:hypothetical protein Tco_0493777 [Tanacetum coccineum]
MQPKDATVAKASAKMIMEGLEAEKELFELPSTRVRFHLSTTPFCSGSGYQQKDRKPSQNDKTEHGMEKTVQNQGQSPKMPKSE